MLRTRVLTAAVGLPIILAAILLGDPVFTALVAVALAVATAEFMLGAGNRRIMFRHILPNLVAPIIVYTTLLIPTNILFEASLSFLGVGVQPPRASWGSMIADAVNIFESAWWYMFFPGMALLLTVLAFNLVGDGLQDALNPRSDR